MAEPIRFTSVLDGKEIKLFIKPETLEIQRKCDNEYSVAYVQAIKEGVPPRSVLEKFLRDQDMWTDKDDSNMEALRLEIVGLETQLAATKTLDSGLPLAAKLAELRGNLIDIIQRRGEVLNNSAEFMAEQVRRDAYIAYATMYEDTNKIVFKSYADLIARSEEQVALDSRAALAKELFKELGRHLDSLPEAAFRNIGNLKLEETKEVGI